jgi:flagellar hook protein FlgE
MSINSALAAGASGLVANSSALAAISDNIANVNTVGYKRVDTVFTPNYKIGGGGETRYASSGVSTNSRLDVNTAGLLNPGSSPTDMAIDGAGFFVVRPTPSGASSADAVQFTRSGSFETDNEGFLRNDAGQYLFAWPVRPDGTVSLNPSNLNDLEAVNLTNIGGTAQATSSVRINANLQASQAVSPAAATYAAGAFQPPIWRPAPSRRTSSAPFRSMTPRAASAR